MRRTVAVLGFMAVLTTAAASLTVVPGEATVNSALTQETFLVPADDGYGIGECLAAGGECGRVVAKAWCETHGFSRVEAFGIAPADAVTGSIRPVRLEARAPISITCSN